MRVSISTAFSPPPSPPGSIFKTVTLAAALEELPGLEERTWICEGSAQIGDETVTCTAAHGEQDIRRGPGQLLQRGVRPAGGGAGRRTPWSGMPEQAGPDQPLLRQRHPHCRRQLYPSRALSDGDLAWAGVGQYHDAVNPCVHAGLHGGHRQRRQGRRPVPDPSGRTRPGLPALPQFTRRTGTPHCPGHRRDPGRHDGLQRHRRPTATSRFPNMDLCAKSGTAEVGGGQAPHAWFAGFLRDEDHPYAFLVLVENGGSGSSAAGDVASRVLNALVSP